MNILENLAQLNAVFTRFIPMPLWALNRNFTVKILLPRPLGKILFLETLFDKAKLLFMGVDFQVATIIHYVEEKFTVPYRFMKEFSGKVVEDDTEKDFTARIYSRDLELDPKLNTKKLQDFLIQNGVAKESVLGRGKLMSVGVLEFCDCVLSFLQKNPYNLAEVSKS